MKEYLNIFSRSVVFCFVLLMLQACGGDSKSNEQQKSFQISADTTAISFSNEFLQVSEDTFQVKVNFVGEGLLVGFAPDSDTASWLNYSTSDLTDTSATIEIKVISADQLPPNNYTTKLRLSSGDVNTRNLVHHDIDISLLVWHLGTDKDLISYDSTLGDETVAAQPLTISSLGENSWKISSDVEWLSFDVNEGVGEATVNVSADISTFNSPEKYVGNVILTETTTGDSRMVPVEVGIDNVYFYADSSGVLLTQTPNIQVPQKQLTIQTNSPDDGSWLATTETAWLAVSQDNDKLTLSLKDTQALSNGTHQGAVTVTKANDSQQILPLTLEVNFYKSDQATENKVINEVLITSVDYTTSPKLPRVYLTKEHNLQTYHSYTGELLAELAVAPEGSRLERLIMHPQGDILLAKAVETIVNEDETTTTEVHFYKIDLLTNAIEELAPDIEFDPVKFVTITGRHFVVSQILELADANLQRKFGPIEGAFFSTVIEQASITESLFALDFSDSSINRFELSANDFTADTISLVETHSYIPELLLAAEEQQAVTNMVVSPLETDIYLISPTSEWLSFDGSTFVDNGLLEQSEDALTIDLVIAQNGLAHYTRYDDTSGFYIDIYQKNSKTNTVLTQGQQPNTVQLSADDKRLVIHAANTQRIELISIEQFELSTQQLTFSSHANNNITETGEVTINGISEQFLVNSSEEWLAVSTAYSEEGVLTLTTAIDASKISGWGRFTATINVYDPTTDSTSSILVTVNIDETRLFSDGLQAVAFKDLDGLSHLAQTLTIVSNNSEMPQWQAKANVNWLSLTTNQADNTLSILADASGLTDDIHYGEITLSSTENGQALDRVIPVSLYKENIVAEEVNVENISVNTNGLVLDPLRPYTYIAQGDQIRVIHMFTGEVVHSIASPLADIDLTDLVIHPDGSVLLVSNTEEYQDDNDQTQTRINHYQVDLTTQAITQLDAETISIDTRYRPATIALVDGKEVIVTQVREYADFSLQSLYWDLDNVFFVSQFNHVVSNSQLLAYDQANNTIVNTQLAYNEFSDNKISQVSEISYQNEMFSGNGVISNMATSKDGANLYTASLGTEWATFDGQEYSDQGLLHNAVVLATVATQTNANNELFFYRFVFGVGFVLSKYDANQQVLWDVIHTTGSTNIFMSTQFNRLMSLNEGVLNLDSIPE